MDLDLLLTGEISQLSVEKEIPMERLFNYNAGKNQRTPCPPSTSGGCRGKSWKTNRGMSLASAQAAAVGPTGSTAATRVTANPWITPRKRLTRKSVRTRRKSAHARRNSRSQRTTEKTEEAKLEVRHIPMGYVRLSGKA